MTELLVPAVDTPEGQAMSPEDADRKRKKKKDKVRSAWISFVGRIIAQVMGAAATISLGLMLVHKYQLPSETTPMAAAKNPAPSVAPVRAATPGEPSLAVLPLQNFSGDGDLSFANAMTEAAIARLSRLAEIRVVSRTSSTLYRQQHQTLPEIARALGVDYVIEGSVIKVNRRVRITAQLIHARSDEHLWAESYDRTLRDVLAVQTDVAEAIARAVRRTLSIGPLAPAGGISQRALDIRLPPAQPAGID